ncbi:SDR family NAD(P)-dependent oxidoreductase [Phaeobacter sp. B1627]|uniref:SDR family NAD(P)-dependent oxidoreductase n=1 Tax=Phaeobacter sp. B1627 TaxID=2583809 RepID=UPI00111BBD6F|nr:SDR family NAD(P)-dependent oxidoreductase [Phaeobacter sp. B1627]TNJ48053.1 SDR family oxidoreductase [Phaeobacter sp. B1627]
MNFGTEFEGKHVIVTGALGVVGRWLADGFGKLGAKLCLTDTDQSALDALAAELGAEGSFGCACDLRDAKAIDALVSEVGQRWGAADVLINNAGVYPSGFLLDTDAEQWDRILDINLRAVHLMTRGIATQMIGANRKGSVINISSGAARKMRLTAAPYSLSKTALDRLTKGYGLELARYGIRVNALEPGFAAGSTASPLPEEHVKRVTASMPLGRASTADDVVPAALYLASEAASFVTGATLTVDGGNSIGSMDVYQDKKAPL